MTEDDAISSLFHEAIDSFPAEMQEAARAWLSEREAALMLIREIETKGLEALL